MGNNLRRNQLILTSALGLILAMYLLAYWLPHRRDNQRVSAQIEATRRAADLQKNQIDRLPELKGEVAQLEAFIDLLTRPIPARLNEAEFVSIVHRISAQRDVDVAKATPRLPARVLDVQQNTVELALVGSFPAIAAVLYDLETREAMTQLSQLHVQRLQSGDLSADVTVQLTARPAAAAVSSRAGE